MPRRVQDIVPNSHRSIRDVPVERNRADASIQQSKEKTSSKPKIHTTEVRLSDKEKITGDLVLVNKDSKINQKDLNIPVKRISVTPPHHSKKKGSNKGLLILVGIVVIVAGTGYVASVYFSKATFTLQSRVVPITVNSTYIAQNAGIKSPLSYELSVVKNSSSITVSAVDGAQISTTAKGKVTVYNSYSSGSQRLVAGTRLSDDTGRIYRLTSSITIPGYTNAKGTITPGSIVTTVSADKPGESYNISRSDSISDFKIVAYKGTARYDSMYARLASDISGGFIGKKKTISSDILASSTAMLQAKITATLLSQVKENIPEGYIMYANSYVTSFGTPTIGGTDSKTAVITLQGTLYGILFKKTELVNRIAGQTAVDQFENYAYDTPGLDNLEFSISNKKDFSPEKKNTLIINLKGDALLVGSIPVETLKAELAGLSLSETRAILIKYKPVIDVENSSGEVTPPWSRVPSVSDRIAIKILTK
ncbi:MAG: hypothetical protein AAB470_00345 [Patescibacteria group bacterium]